MAISVSCPCGKTLTVKDELAGKRGKCPQCAAPLTIPLLATPPENPAAMVPAAAAVPTVPQFVPPIAPGSAYPYQGYPPNSAAVPLQPLAVPLSAAMAIPVVQPLPAVWAYPVNNTAVTPVMPEVVGITPTARSLAGPTPAPLALAPQPGQFSADRKPPILASPVVAAVLPEAAPQPVTVNEHFDREGMLLCPYCNNHLQKTSSAGNSIFQIMLGLFVGFYFVPTTPYKCRRCGPIAANQLRGASLRTAQKSSRNFALVWLFGIIFVFVIACLVIVSGVFEPNPGAQQLHQQQRLAEINRQAEMQRRQNELRFKQEAERQKQERERKMREDALRQRK